MRYPEIQKLERTPLSENVYRYSDEELLVIFRRLSPYMLNRWMNHFIQKEAYEVCSLLKQVMEEKRI